MWIERQLQIWVSVHGDDEQSHQRLACDSGGLYIGQTRVESVCYTTSHMEVVYERDQNFFHDLFILFYMVSVYFSFQLAFRCLIVNVYRRYLKIF